MPDIIRLLPDSVANQIAAGEVIQRPASVVKELLENSIDAGATQIKLIVKDVGKTLIQIIDNGIGMSETDARLCFERHATSKIHDANDLFSIKTMGFRGEALASIAAIAQVEIKTRKEETDLGTCIIIEGSEVKNQSPCQLEKGASIMVKNLFFNVPARRNFLKSNPVEMKHIHDEFSKVALANPNVSFQFFENNNLILKLDQSNLKQRIANLYSNSHNQKIIPVEQETNIINIKGFVCKPENVRKTRGEQFLFVNNRYIKHPYFNHAIGNAYKELIPESAFPSYFLFLEVDTANIDINIHPTKTEVKFLDEKVIYSIIRAAVRQSLGKFTLTPTIDFDVENSFNYTPPKPGTPVNPPAISTNKEYNPFSNPKPSSPPSQNKAAANLPNWEKLYEGFEKKDSTASTPDKPENKEHAKTVLPADFDSTASDTTDKQIFQLAGQFIISKVKSGLLIIDQNRAHERILYERFLKMDGQGKAASQQCLFPHVIELSHSDSEIVNELLDDLKNMGLDINPMGAKSFSVNGMPPDVENNNAEEFLDMILESFKSNPLGSGQQKNINLARSMAKAIAVKHGKKLLIEEMEHIINELFSCDITDISPDGRKIHSIVGVEEISNILK